MTPRTHKHRTLTPKQAVTQILRRLHDAGFEALLAGGCVRDMLLGHKPKDYDVATSATPQEITHLFKRTLTVGAQFGVVVVLIANRQIEVATFRTDDDYHDGRRPSAVTFTDARQDALRRDFTINGMFYDLLNDKVIDYVSGQKDLERGVIRAIGHPEDRIAEDHLRMLRAIRFTSRLEFQIDKKTFQAIQKQAAKITKVSSERIMMELGKIFTDPQRFTGLQLALESSLLKHVFTEMTGKQIQAGMETVAALPRQCSLALALSAFLVEVTPDKVSITCRQLKTSNDLRKQTVWLVENRGQLLELIPLSKGRLKQWLAKPLFEPLCRLIQAHLQARDLPLTPLRQLKKQIKEIEAEPISPRRLLDGHELIRLGATAGPMVGRLTQELYLAQLENHITTKTAAQKWVKNWIVQHNHHN
jgi:tRNA nucleotidyltransferase/poly(A) polymerase